MLILPELIIIITAFLVLAAGLVSSWEDGPLPSFLSLAGVASALAVAVGYVGQFGELFGGRLQIDPLGMWMKISLLLAAGLTIAFAGEYFKPDAKSDEHPLHGKSEFFTVLLFTFSGMMFLVSSNDLLTLYVSLELATIPLFLLVAWSQTRRSGEAALKYVIFGALASAFLLYGFGFIYALTGTTAIPEIAGLLRESPALWFAAGLVIAGMGFKMTLFPFHMWAPDVYEGAPTPVTAYLSVASKAAGLILAFQIFLRIFGAYLVEWSFIVTILAAATMTLGNIVAILQTNIKRFMAYSSISQAGYLVLGFLGRDGAEVGSMVFYLLIYVLTNLAAFAIIILRTAQSGREDLGAFRGLSRTNPLLALALMIALFGLAGIPPLSGFVGKFFLFSVAAHAGVYWLVALAAVNSTVSLYYYLRVVRQMYIEPVAGDLQPLRLSPLPAVAIGLATLGSVFVGIIPYFYETIGRGAAYWIEQL